MEECNQFNSQFLRDFELFIPCLTAIFFGSEYTRFIAATIRHARDKKSKAIFKAKAELNYQSNLCFLHAFEIFLHFLTISFGELSARVSLNVVTSGSLTGWFSEYFQVIILK